MNTNIAFEVINEQDCRFFKGLSFQDQVQYHMLFDLISGPHVTFRYGNQLVAVLVEGKPLWLWAADPSRIQSRLLKALAEHLITEGFLLCGVAGATELALPFAKWYSSEVQCRYDLEYHHIAFYCKEPKSPVVKGRPYSLTNHEALRKIAGYIKCFEEENFSRTNPFQRYIGMAESLCLQERLLAWGDYYRGNEEIVSMCIISSKSFGFGRINYFYTHRPFRQKGYGQSFLSFVSKELLKEALIPVLYVDTKNSEALKLYHKGGYLETGRIDHFAFTQ